jgi:hypothetical protein
VASTAEVISPLSGCVGESPKWALPNRRFALCLGKPAMSQLPNFPIAQMPWELRYCASTALSPAMAFYQSGLDRHWTIATLHPLEIDTSLDISRNCTPLPPVRVIRLVTWTSGFLIRDGRSAEYLYLRNGPENWSY